MKTKIDIEKLRVQLPHGAQTEIAKKSGVSLQTVHYVLKGKSANLRVLSAIADYMEHYNSTEQRITSLIHQ